jgi:hypothetical protein
VASSNKKVLTDEMISKPPASATSAVSKAKRDAMCLRTAVAQLPCE